MKPFTGRNKLWVLNYVNAVFYYLICLWFHSLCGPVNENKIKLGNNCSTRVCLQFHHRSEGFTCQSRYRVVFLIMIYYAKLKINVF